MCIYLHVNKKIYKMIYIQVVSDLNSEITGLF